MRIVVTLLLVATAWGADSEIATQSAKLSVALKAKQFDEAESLIDVIAEKYGDAAPDEKKVAIKAIGSAVASKEESTRDIAMDALAKLKAPGSSKYLKRWMTPPSRHVGSESNIKALQSAGAIADKSTLSLLKRLSDHKNTDVAFEATKALGGYKGHSVKMRKRLAIELVKRMEKNQPSTGSRGWGRAAAESTREDTEETGTPRGRLTSNNPEVRRKQIVYGSRLALIELTGKEYSTIAEWSSWRKRAKKSKNPFS